jgi:uncharacterized membrane protein YdjX (TVP38/TMEM64 family)
MTHRSKVKIAVALFIAAVVAALWFSPLRAYLTRDNVRMAVEQLRGIWYGPIVFILVYGVACIFAVPASLFCIAAGFIWGWLIGGTYTVIGGLLGAIASFFVARFVGEGLIHRFGRLGQFVAKQADHAGFRSLLVLRFIPGIPFAVLNYGAGVAGVRFRDYVAATFIGILPPTFVFAYCADALFNGTISEGVVLQRMLIAAALMIGITLLPLLVKRLTKRAALPDEQGGET